MDTAVLFAFGTTVLLFVAWTQRRRARTAAAQLDRERQLGRRLRDGSASGVLMVDSAWRLTGWNPAMEQLTGLPERTVLARGLADIPAVAAPGLTDTLRLALQGIEMTAEFVIPSPSGTPIALRAYSTPIRDQRGRVSGAIAIINPVHAAAWGPPTFTAGRLETSAA